MSTVGNELSHRSDDGILCKFDIFGKKHPSFVDKSCFFLNYCYLQFICSLEEIKVFRVFDMLIHTNKIISKHYECLGF